VDAVYGPPGPGDDQDEGVPLEPLNELVQFSCGFVSTHLRNPTTTQNNDPDYVTNLLMVIKMR